MIDFSTLQGLTIPEGVVTEIADAQGRVLWSYGSPVVLEVAKQTLTTYAGETEYANESFVLLDIYPKNANSTVRVTYGGLTKTLEFSGTNAQQVYFGTFNGVTDDIETPANGTLTIDGEYNGFACGSYQSSSKAAAKGYCSCITNVNDWGAVKVLESHAFHNCTKLTNIELPKGVYWIPPYTFYGCTNLEFIKFSSSNVAINGYAFYNCTKLALTELPSSTYFSGSYIFYGCTNLALTSLPDGIISIPDYTFYKCSKLALTELPSGITSIGDSAFYNCKNIEICVIPEGVTSIGDSAFYNCKNIEICVIPEGVTSIGANAFYMDDMELTKMWKVEITLPSTIQSMYDSTFMGEENLLVQPGMYWYPTSITILAVVPPTLYYASGAKGNVEKITVPKGCGEAYKAAEGWSRYANYIVEVSE